MGIAVEFRHDTGDLISAYGMLLLCRSSACDMWDTEAVINPEGNYLPPYLTSLHSSLGEMSDLNMM